MHLCLERKNFERRRRNYGKPLANGREDRVVMQRHLSQKIILKNNIVVIETSIISCYYLLN